MSSADGRRRSPFFHQNSSYFSNHTVASLSSHKVKRSSVTGHGSNFESRPTANNNFEYVGLQRKILNKLGYCGISTTRILEFGSYMGQNYYQLTSNTPLGIFLYTILHINVLIKAIFLSFLVAEYFGPIEFLDKIASLDYILCTGLVVIGAWMFLFRYPFYEYMQGNYNVSDIECLEILGSMWKVLNSIYWKHGCPDEMRTRMDKVQRLILKQHLIIIFGGCAALMTQFFPDPKYCTFTYSSFKADNWPLRLLFAAHEFFFMMMAWNGYAGPSSMCMYQGVAISTVINRMNESLKQLFQDEMMTEKAQTQDGVDKLVIRKKIIQPKKVAPEYNIDNILLDYKQLMLISDRFNASVAYKTLFLHLCGGSQFVSDVFAATHVLRLPGTGFLDVWFYIWDCMSAGFMLLRVYHFMGMVSDAAETFLASFKQYMTFQSSQRKYLCTVARTLKVVTLNVGPCEVWPESVLAVLDQMGNYYVCAALW